MNDEMREAIVNRAPARQLKDLAQQAGVQLIRASALELVRRDRPHSRKSTVSPLWHDEIGAYLSPHRVCLVRMQRGVRPKPIAEHEQALESAHAGGWSAPLDALEALLTQPDWQGAHLRVVLADHWARYAIVPWAAALSSTGEQLAHAANC